MLIARENFELHRVVALIRLPHISVDFHGFQHRLFLGCIVIENIFIKKCTSFHIGVYGLYVLAFGANEDTVWHCI